MSHDFGFTLYVNFGLLKKGRLMKGRGSDLSTNSKINENVCLLIKTSSPPSSYHGFRFNVVKHTDKERIKRNPLSTFFFFFLRWSSSIIIDLRVRGIGSSWVNKNRWERENNKIQLTPVETTTGTWRYSGGRERRS